MSTMHDYLRQRKMLKSPESLHRKIAGMVTALPDREPVVTGVIWARPTFAFVAVVLILFLSGGMVVAAQASKPGSPLFPLKKAIVNVQVALTKDESTKAKLRQEVEVPTPTTIVTKPQPKTEVKKNGNDDNTTLMRHVEDALHSGDTSGDTHQASGSHDGDDDTKATIQTTTNAIKTEADDHNTFIVNPTPTPTQSNGGGSNGSGSTPGGSGNSQVNPSPTSPPAPTNKPDDDDGGHGGH